MVCVGKAITSNCCGGGFIIKGTPTTYALKGAHTMTADVHFELCHSIETLYEFGRPADSMGDVTDVELYQQIRAEFDRDGSMLYVAFPWVITKTIGGKRKSTATIMNDGKLYLMPGTAHFSFWGSVRKI